METENQVELTAEEQALLNTEFPAEIEKLAEAQLASIDCVEALRTFGAAKAEAELLQAAGDEEGVQAALEKQAAAAEVIEENMKKIRAHNFETESELDEEQLDEVLVKEASAAAHVIAEGYFGEYHQAAEENPELVKIAKMNLMKSMGKGAKAVQKGAMKAGKYAVKKVKAAGKAASKAGKKSYKALKGGAASAAGAAKDASKSVKKHVKANPKKYSALAGFAGGVGAAKAHEKASE